MGSLPVANIVIETDFGGIIFCILDLDLSVNPLTCFARLVGVAEHEADDLGRTVDGVLSSEGLAGTPIAGAKSVVDEEVEPDPRKGKVVAEVKEETACELVAGLFFHVGPAVGENLVFLVVARLGLDAVGVGFELPFAGGAEFAEEKGLGDTEFLELPGNGKDAITIDVDPVELDGWAIFLPIGDVGRPRGNGGDGVVGIELLDRRANLLEILGVGDFLGLGGDVEGDFVADAPAEDSGVVLELGHRGDRGIHLRLLARLIVNPVEGIIILGSGPAVAHPDAQENLQVVFLGHVQKELGVFAGAPGAEGIDAEIGHLLEIFLLGLVRVGDPANPKGLAGDLKLGAGDAHGGRGCGCGRERAQRGKDKNGKPRTRKNPDGGEQHRN